MRKALLLTSALVVAPAYADTPEYVAVLNGPTLHISPNRYNRSTWGAGIGVYISSACFVGVGRYNNSIEIPTNYTGISCFKNCDNGLVLELAAGTATGYASHPIPTLFPSIGYKINNIRFLITVLPPLPGVKATTINGRLEVEF